MTTFTPEPATIAQLSTRIVRGWQRCRRNRDSRLAWKIGRYRESHVYQWRPRCEKKNKVVTQAAIVVTINFKSGEPRDYVRMARGNCEADDSDS
jgi:hypothetical protein